MDITVTDWGGGAGLALFTYLLTVVIGLLVVVLIRIMYRLIHKQEGKAAPPKDERKVEEILT